MSESESINLQSALCLADQGFRVIPIVPPSQPSENFSKKSSSNGKAPRIKNWQHDASSDPEQIRKWWTAHPNDGIAILTGHGFFVLDIDGKEGAESLAALECKHSPLPATRSVKTPRGRHLYFRCPDNLTVQNSVSKIGNHLDVRGANGYAIAPPSLHASGLRYAWLDETAPIASAPDWLVSLITAEDVSSEITIPVGQRNDTLFRKACALLQSGMRLPDVSMAIALLNQTQCSPPLDDSEVGQIISSASRYESTPNTKRETKRRNPLYWIQVFVLEDLASQELRLMTDYQYGWYSRLRDTAWLKAGILPDDFEQLFKLSGAGSRKKFREQMHVALFEFTPTILNGQRVLVNHAMAENWSNALDKWLQTKAARAARDAKQQAEIENEVAA